MMRFLVGFGEYAIFLSTLCLFLIHSANGEAVCNVLSYGTKEVCIAYLEINKIFKKLSLTYFQRLIMHRC